MSTPATPPSPKPAGDDRNLVAADVETFEEKLQVLWQKNGNAILTVIALVLAGILAKGGWDYLAKQKELGVQKDYAVASTPEQLKAFANSHADHPLAGVALLRVADEAYAAGKAADALAAYDKALPALKDPALSARAKLGRAVAKAVGGKATEATTELKQLSDDANLPKSVRTEATYHLASLAADAGNAADVQKYAEKLMQLDANGPWAARAMSLRASLPAAPAAVAAPAKADEKKADASAPVQVKLPGK